jgi:mannose-6-phosphate isomerase-like protein (cupin superfamily)
MGTYTEKRPWGRFEKLHENKPCTVKLIYINANSRLSLQYHMNRSEYWRVVRGTASVELDGKKFVLKEGDSIEIPRKAKHRLGSIDGGCVVLEIAYGKFDEADIVRLEDDYNRGKSVTPQASNYAFG